MSATLGAQAAWTRLYPNTSPLPRSDSAFAFDSVRGRALLFGGQINGQTMTNQLWQWDGTNWSLAVPSSSPSARGGMAMAFDEARGRLVVFGGNDGNGILQETLEWDGTGWNLRLPANHPSARTGHAMAYDPVRHVIMLFGGYATAALGDQWEWDGQIWTQRTFAGGPGPRNASALTFDPTTGQMLLFGGSSGGVPLDETWLWNGQTWSQPHPLTPPYVRVLQALVSDLARRRVVLLGGSPTPDPFAWEWDGSEWQCQFVSSPSPRYGRVLAYDPARREVLMFGGYGLQSGPLGDTWIYRTPHAAAFTSYGQGCPGSAGTPVLSAAPYSLPWVGDTFRTLVNAVPVTSPGAVFVTGVASTPAQSLTPFGLTGCASFVTFDSSRFVPATAGVAEWSIQIPINASLTGLQLFQQALVFDGAAAGGAVVSNAGAATVGIR